MYTNCWHAYIGVSHNSAMFQPGESGNLIACLLVFTTMHIITSCTDRIPALCTVNSCGARLT